MRSRASLSAASACGSQDFAAASISSAANAHADLGQIEPIEFQRQLQKRAVAIGLHLGDDAAHAIFHVLRGLAFDGEEGAEPPGKVGALAIQSKRHGLILPGFQVNG